MDRRTVGETMNRRPIVLLPDVFVDDALRLAHDRQIHHLLVQGDDRIVRVVCLCDLLGRQSLVDALEALCERAVPRRLAEFFQRRAMVVGPEVSVEAAADLMARECIGCLPVVLSGDLIGVLTRTDLRHAGVPADAEIDAHCAACGEIEDVRRIPELPGAGFCPSCWDDILAPVGDEEIGAAD